MLYPKKLGYLWTLLWESQIHSSLWELKKEINFCGFSIKKMFDVQVTMQNQLYALISQMYFWNKTLHVSDRSSVHHQEFFTVHTAMVYVIQVCWQLASRIRMELVPSWSCSQAVSKPAAVWISGGRNALWNNKLTACEQDQDGTIFILILLASCQQTCMTYTIAVCTVKNSWWWTEELSETCKVLFQK